MGWQGIQIRRAEPDRAAHSRRALVLVGHGSRCVYSELEMDSLGRLVAAALPEVTVAVGYLEMTDPPAGAVIDRLAVQGCDDITVLPLMLLGAGHSKSDVPAVVLDARARHGGVQIRFGSPLGVTRAPVEILGKAVVAAGGAGLPLLTVARGTSDPDANADACKAGRLLAEWTGAPFSHVGFSGVTTPSVADAAEVFARLGFGRVAVAWWYLCHGKLIERGREELAGFASRIGVELVDAGHIGPHEDLVPLIVSRYSEARSGEVVVNCDACAYRAPWPGREDRVGQSIGTGHSHLAEAHRGGGHSHSH